MTRAQKWLLWGGAALIVAVNAVLLTGVAWNRSGEPTSALTLSERELTLPYRYGLNSEYGGVELTLQWRALPSGKDDSAQYTSYYGGSPGWLDDAKLRALGFDLASELKEERVRDRPQREVFLVLELAGEAWQRAQAGARTRLERALARDYPGTGEKEKAAARETAEQAARDALDDELHRASRLFAVDAGTDAAALRARYPDLKQYAIVRARVTATSSEVDGRPVWRGWVSGLAVGSISVPHALAGQIPLRDASSWRDGDGQDAVPALDIDLSWGRRFEPWITAIRARSPAPGT